MRQHILYISSAKQIQLAEIALGRLQAQRLSDEKHIASRYQVEHWLLGDMTVDISLITNVDGITPHLRHNPVDLLIYDERGDDSAEAIATITKIRRDVQALADNWGPDFLFPMSRVVVILDQEDKEAHRVFSLGQLDVRDVCISPKSTAHLLKWIRNVLWQGIKRDDKIGMVLSGGGVEGFLYQMGVLHALEQALGTGRKALSDVDVVSGISSGAIAGAMFASALPVGEVIKALYRRSKILPPFTSSVLFDIAGIDITRRIVKQSIAWAGLSPRRWIDKTLKSVPTGFFKGDSLEQFFRTAMLSVGENDSFSNLKSELLIGATDQDTFEHVIFGDEPWKDVKISEAMRASCALPPVFLPKQIKGRWFIDGQVTKTCNIELAIEKGCRLIVIINPLKPQGSNNPGTTDKEGGLYGIIQTVKALVSTRFAGVLKHVAQRHPDVDFVVFEPEEECAQLMAGSPMRYRIRTKVIEQAYRETLRKLRDRHHVYSSKFAKYGLELCSVERLKELDKLETDVFSSVA